MNLLPVTLSVKRRAFRSDAPHAAATDAAYMEARKKVLARDDFTCRFCGFRHKTNEVHHANDDHNDQRLENLLTACVLCHMSFHIAFAGIRGRAKLIYLPDAKINQADLNQIVRNLWIAELMGKDDLRQNAAQLLARLEKAEIHAHAVLGTSSPAVLGDFMASLSDEDYEKRAEPLEGIYLLHLKKAYAPQIKQWCEASKNFTPDAWVSQARQKFESWGGIIN